MRVLQYRALKGLARALGDRHPDADADQVDADLGESAAHATAARPRGPPTGPEGTPDGVTRRFPHALTECHAHRLSCWPPSR